VFSTASGRCLTVTRRAKVPHRCRIWAGLAGLVVPPAAAATAAPARQPDAEQIRQVTAIVETPSLFDDDAGGNADADDPAIWVDQRDRAASLVIATAKNGGLRVYDLRGRELQAIATPPAPGPDHAPGRFNNVDLVSGFWLAGRRVDLAVVTDRGLDQLRFYRINGATTRAPLR
jgi:3-phytase